MGAGGDGVGAGVLGVVGREGAMDEAGSASIPAQQALGLQLLYLGFLVLQALGNEAGVSHAIGLHA